MRAFKFATRRAGCKKRGRDGTKRPVADLMSPDPCGFCRCSSDMLNSELITLPPLAERPKPAELVPSGLGSDSGDADGEPEQPPAEPEPPTQVGISVGGSVGSDEEGLGD